MKKLSIIICCMLSLSACSVGVKNEDATRIDELATQLNKLDITLNNATGSIVSVGAQVDSELKQILKILSHLPVATQREILTQLPLDEQAMILNARRFQ